MPAAFTGQARQLVQQALASDLQFNAALDVLRAAVDRRMARKTTLRREAVADLVRQYRATVPSAFRIGNIDVTGDHRALSIGETRVGRSDWLCRRWQNPSAEAGLLVQRVTLSMDRLGASVALRPLAAASQHAVARWFQRSGSADTAALLADLAGATGDLLDDLPDAGQPVEAQLRCQHGIWCGRWVMAGLYAAADLTTPAFTAVVFAARSFLSHDDAAPRAPRARPALVPERQPCFVASR